MSPSATSMFKLDPAPKVITFDCYGTLVQWYEVLLREIEVTLAAHGQDEATAPAILDAFSAQGRRLTAEKPHRLYNDILHVGFAAAFRDHGLKLNASEMERIAASPTTMAPHPEVPDVLRGVVVNFAGEGIMRNANIALAYLREAVESESIEQRLIRHVRAYLEELPSHPGEEFSALT